MDRRIRGFTLVELLVVVVIIGLLAGILLPALLPTKRNAKIKQTRVAATTIGSAIQGYQYQKRKWPVPDEHQGTPDHTYSNNNWLVLTLLTNTTPPLLNMDDIKTSPDGAAVDAWGGPLHIKVDTDYDTRVEVNNRTYHGYHVWSTNSNM